MIGFPVLTSSGASLLPVADATYYTIEMPASADTRCHVYIEFFAANGTTVVTPSGGTITCYGSPAGENYILIKNAVNAADCGAGNSTYTPPVLEGRVLRGKVVLSGVTGASFARITYVKF